MLIAVIQPLSQDVLMTGAALTALLLKADEYRLGKVAEVARLPGIALDAVGAADEFVSEICNTRSKKQVLRVLGSAVGAICKNTEFSSHGSLQSVNVSPGEQLSRDIPPGILFIAAIEKRATDSDAIVPGFCKCIGLTGLGGKLAGRSLRRVTRHTERYAEVIQQQSS
jgi:hypothetical protein